MFRSGLRLCVNFINVLGTAFTPVAPQSLSTQSSYQYLFTLLGSTSVKAVRRMLMKMSPCVNFINVLCFKLLQAQIQKAQKWLMAYQTRKHCLKQGYLRCKWPHGLGGGGQRFCGNGEKYDDKRGGIKSCLKLHDVIWARPLKNFFGALN